MLALGNGHKKGKTCGSHAKKIVLGVVVCRCMCVCIDMHWPVMLCITRVSL